MKRQVPRRAEAEKIVDGGGVAAQGWQLDGDLAAAGQRLGGLGGLAQDRLLRARRPVPEADRGQVAGVRVAGLLAQGALQLRPGDVAALRRLQQPRLLALGDRARAPFGAAAPDRAESQGRAQRGREDEHFRAAADLLGPDVGPSVPGAEQLVVLEAVAGRLGDALAEQDLPRGGGREGFVVADLEQPVAVVPGHPQLHRNRLAGDPQEVDAEQARGRGRRREAAEELLHLRHLQDRAAGLPLPGARLDREGEVEQAVDLFRRRPQQLDLDLAELLGLAPGPAQRGAPAGAEAAARLGPGLAELDRRVSGRLADGHPAAAADGGTHRRGGGRALGDAAQEQRPPLAHDLRGEAIERLGGPVEQVGGLAQLAASGELQGAALPDQRGDRLGAVALAQQARGEAKEARAASVQAGDWVGRVAAER